MDNKIILSFHDSVLYSSDLKILKSSKEWLNDRIISFYFEYLSRNIFDDGKILLIGEIQDSEDFKYISMLTHSLFLCICRSWSDTGNQTD